MVPLSFSGPQLLYLQNGVNQFLWPAPNGSWEDRVLLGRGEGALAVRDGARVNWKPQAVAERPGRKLPGALRLPMEKPVFGAQRHPSEPGDVTALLSQR